MADEWNIGTLDKTGIWAFYWVSNYLGVVLCALLIWFVIGNKKRTASDIFTCGLASGCLTMSLTCGTQCIVNMIGQRFVGGEIACQLEAIAHVSAILTEFFCSTCVSLWTVSMTMTNRTIDGVKALQIVIAIWILCIIVTGLASLVSPIYLMSAGLYCFFEFSSLAIAGWLVPGLIMALVAMIVAHYKVVTFLTRKLSSSSSPTLIISHPSTTCSITNDSSHGNPTIVLSIPSESSPQSQVTPPSKIRINGQHGSLLTEQGIWLKSFRLRSATFIICLLLGWGFAAITTIYEFAVGPANEWLVTAVGVGGVSFSWAMPLTYALSCPQFREFLMCKRVGRTSHSRSLSKGTTSNPRSNNAEVQELS